MSTPLPSRRPSDLDASAGLDRRSFLQLAGFSLAAAGLAGCSRAPVQTALSLLEASEDVVAGRPYWIASTSWADGAGNGVLVRCRDGRPLKLEGNPDHPVNRGGLTAACQASLLSLYDDHRLHAPLRAGRPATWGEVDAAIGARLDAIRASGGRVRLLTSTLTGPSTLAWIEQFLGSLPDARHVMYDALSCSALLDARAATRGVRVLPRYDLSRARVLACFDADVLGTWISPAGFAANYQGARRPDASPPRMSRHWQLESRLSLTGTRADRRVRLAPWEIAPGLALLGGALARRAGTAPPDRVPDGAALPAAARAALDELAGELWAHRGESLVLCGRNDRDAQVLVAWIDELLGAEGRTLDLSAPSLQRRGDDTALAGLRDELLAGSVDLLVVAGANPAYDLPGFAGSLARAGTLVSTAPLPDETAALADFVCPEPHELERWDDAEPLAGLFSTTQPALSPLRDVRTLRASLARWSGETRDDRELLADHWRGVLAPLRAAPAEPFEVWFAGVLERGWVELPSRHAARPEPFRTEPVAAALRRVASSAAPPDGALGLVLYPKVGVLDGRGAHNPWLQELPDPVSKVVWDNHLDLSPATARRLGLRTGDVVSVELADGEEPAARELPVLVQPGQDDRVAAVALGYGRLGTDRFTDIGPRWLEARRTVEPGGTVGVNAAPWLELRDGAVCSDGRAVRLVPTGRRRPLAVTQDHHELAVPEHLAPAHGAVRDAVRVVTLDALTDDPAHALPARHASAGDLWADDHPRRAGPRWGLVVDLAACTGCSACVVACQAENNVPVVGRDEVRRHREMAWLRIDRYYAERPDGDVDVFHQPMMCQHCGHAPCESVCPVLATVHSSEGLNTQVYNRCVGTRYCANNCPYKTRRFNWFEYAREGRLQNLALNPDVTVRSRGVMEKCSLCVQRIQAGKAAARRDGREPVDGEITTACQQSCPTRAIVFGDLSDPESAVARRAASPRAYRVLEELNVQPGVHYLAEVRHARGAEGGDRG